MTSMTPRASQKAADLLWRARLEGSRLPALPQDCRPRTLDDGYAVQDEMIARSNRSVSGWKAAATNAAARQRLGIAEPLAGPLFGDFILPAGATIATAPMIMRVAEPEFAFRVGRDLPPRQRPYELDEVMQAMAGLHLAIEVPDSRFEDAARVDAPCMLADAAFAAWFVLGPSVHDWFDRDLAAQSVSAHRNERLVGQSRTPSAQGDPREVLLWLVQDRALRAGGLRSGDVITTGTRITPIDIGPGDSVRIDFPDLGSVAVAFD